MARNKQKVQLDVRFLLLQRLASLLYTAQKKDNQDEGGNEQANRYEGRISIPTACYTIALIARAV